MKIPALSLLLAALVSTPNASAYSEKFFGGKEAHGGIAYVCRDATKKITFARLLDLWEGEELKTWKSDEAVDAQIEKALAKMAAVSPDTASQIRVDLKYVRENTYFTDRLLTSTADALPPYRADEGCAYEQVARYEGVVLEIGKNGLKVSREIFDSPAFTNSDRAALFLHEAVYSRDRANNEVESSNRTRIVIAHLFSESDLPNAIRLTIAAVNGVEMAVRMTEEDKDDFSIKNRLLALKDPTVLNLKFNFYIRSASDLDPLKIFADKTSRYRCRVTQMGGKGETTKWMSISEMNGTKGYLPEGTSPAYDFPLTFKGDIASFDQMLEVKCEKKTSRGTVSEIPFRADAGVDAGTECLYHHGNGNVSLFKNTQCDFMTLSMKLPAGKHIGLIVIRPVPAR